MLTLAVVLTVAFGVICWPLHRSFLLGECHGKCLIYETVLITTFYHKRSTGLTEPYMIQSHGCSLDDIKRFFAAEHWYLDGRIAQC